MLAKGIHDFEIAMRLVVFSAQHAHGGQERNTPLAVPVKTPQQKQGFGE